MDCGVTYEELASFSVGDLEAPRAREVEEHAAGCEGCRRRLDALARADAALAALPRVEPPAEAVLATHRLIAREVRGGRPEIMTLEEAAAFLRISLDDLAEIVLELPAFELAGQLRIRRAKLIEWVQARERAFSRSRARSEVARVLSHAL